MELLYDPTGTLTLRDVATRYAGQFQPAQTEIPMADIGVGVVWVRCTIKNVTPSRPFLLLRDPIIESIEIFTCQDGEHLSSRSGGAVDSLAARGDTIIRRQNGVVFPSGGDLDVVFHTFALARQRTKPQTVYLRVKNFPAVVMDISVGSRSACLRADREHIAFLMILLGVCGAMITYNFFIYTAVRSQAYLYYVLYGVAATITVCYEQGLMPVIIGQVAFAQIAGALAVFTLTPFTLAALFAIRFLNLERIAPIMARMLYAVSGLSAIFVVGYFAGLHEIANRASWPMAYIDVSLLMVAAVVAYQRGYRAARYFLIGWTVWSIALLLYLTVGVIGAKFGLPVAAIVFYAVPFATVSEMMLMSFALADRIKILQQEKIQAQAQAMNMLEDRVRERTKEYENANKALQEAAEEIQHQMIVQKEQQAELEHINAELLERGRQLEEANLELAAANEEVMRQVEVQNEQSRNLKLVNSELAERNEQLRNLNHELDRVNTDISMVNDQLNTQNEQLTALNNEKNEILGMASHDLKNPLTSILGMAEMLRRGQQYNLTPDQYEQFAQRIHESGERMLRLLHNLLDANAVESGRMMMEIVPIHVETAVRAVTHEYLARAAVKNITLHFRNDLPSGAQVLADETALRQVLDNLISNAVKYSPHGKNVVVTLSSELREARPQNEQSKQSNRHTAEILLPKRNHSSVIHVSVKDEGSGLTAEDKHKLFGKFARLSARPTGGEDSTGLGLAIVKRLVESMHGQVWCESIAGEGATFVLELPAMGEVFTLTTSSIQSA